MRQHEEPNSDKYLVILKPFLSVHHVQNLPHSDVRDEGEQRDLEEIFSHLTAVGAEDWSEEEEADHQLELDFPEVREHIVPGFRQERHCGVVEAECDYDKLEEQAKLFKPKLIIAGKLDSWDPI